MLFIQRNLDFRWYVNRVSVPRNLLGLRGEIYSVSFNCVWSHLLSLRDALQINMAWIYLQFFQFFGQGILELFRFVEFWGERASHWAWLFLVSWLLLVHGCIWEAFFVLSMPIYLEVLLFHFKIYRNFSTGNLL